MCGRARCTLNAAQVARACGLRDGDADSVRTIQMDHFRPSYNVSPGSYLPVFTVRREGKESDGGEPHPVVHSMKWGLVPSFTKKNEKPDHFRMFNARSESVKEKASFRRLIPNNRCLVAVEGFYEWKKDGSRKQPFYIHFKDGRPLVFAALYDCWASAEDRMPVILGNQDQIDTWLSNSTFKLETLLRPYEDSDLVWYAVNTAIGKTSFDGPECIKEISMKPVVQNEISKLFSKKIGDNSSKIKLESNFESSHDDFPMNEESGNLKAEPAVDAKELSRENSCNFADLLSPKKGSAGPQILNIKRELDDLGPDTAVESEITDNYSKPVRKKLHTGDKQASLLSYFGKKLG
ncbi:hypothetical protein HPP92_009961 [Vanilla planifolia]|uniref:Embryonic stem cell-specific 5-hydroxymethylcytosine-binding protein n=1 Tax=Vanilla planifolia TaxID=51239 RepID=A0A835RGS5_VANPL|nr:hypothetical protein HPP92_009961 [Vanilla planifolia]